MSPRNEQSAHDSASISPERAVEIDDMIRRVTLWAIAWANGLAIDALIKIQSSRDA